MVCVFDQHRLVNAADAEIGFAHRRIGGEIAGDAVADNAASLDQIAAVGNAQALLGVLLDQQDADAALAHLGERFEQLVRQQRRQAERGFVEQQELGCRHHGAADRHHLLLAAAHGARRLGEAFLEAREKLQHALQVALGAVAGAAGIGAELKVLAHGQVGEDAASLRHQRDAGLDDLVRRHEAKLAAAERHRAAGKQRHQAGNDPEQRALAGAVGAENDHDLAAVDLDVDVGKGHVLAVGGGGVGDPKQRHLRCRRRSRRGRTAHAGACRRRASGRHSSPRSGHRASEWRP